MVYYHVTFENYREIRGFSATLTSPNPSPTLPFPLLQEREGEGGAKRRVGMGEVKSGKETTWYQKFSYVR